MNQPELRKHAFSVVVIERIFLHGDSVNDILALSFSHSPSASKFNMKKHHLTNFNAFDSRCNFKCHCGRKSTSWRARGGLNDESFTQLPALNRDTKMQTEQVLAGEKVGCSVMKRHHWRTCVFLL